MLRLIIIVVVALLIPSSLFAQEKQTYQSKKNKESLVDAYVLGFSYGPVLPKNEFKKISLPKNEQFDGAQYRAVFARHEIYVTLNIDLSGLFEDLGRTVISSYDVPLESALDFDRGFVEFVEWKSYDTLIIKCKGLKPDFLASIKILPGGTFVINRML